LPTYLSVCSISFIIIKTQFVDTSFGFFVCLCPADLNYKLKKQHFVIFKMTLLKFIKIFNGPVSALEKRLKLDCIARTILSL